MLQENNWTLCAQTGMDVLLYSASFPLCIANKMNMHNAFSTELDYFNDK